MLRRSCNINSLANAIVLNANIGEIENEMANVTVLVKKTVYDAKIYEIKWKYLNTIDYHKFTISILDTKKNNNNNKNLVNEVNISSLLKNSDLNTKLATLATKA